MVFCVTVLYVLLFFFKDLFLLFLYWKGGYTERRDREEDLPSDGSLPKRLQQLELSQSEARSFFQVSHVGAGSQVFGLTMTAFPGHRQGAGWEAGPPGLEPAPMWESRRGSRRGLQLLGHGSRLSINFSFFFFKDLFLLFFHWKGGYTERRDREEDLPSDDSLPK